MSDMPTEDNQPKSKGNAKQSIIALAIIGVVAIGAVFVFTRDKDTTKPSYEARIANYEAIDSKTIRAAVVVNNTGTLPGRPICTIRANSPNHTSTGFETADYGQSLNPGQEWKFGAQITVTNNGAADVTEASVECH